MKPNFNKYKNYNKSKNRPISKRLRSNTIIKNFIPTTTDQYINMIQYRGDLDVPKELINFLKVYFNITNILPVNIHYPIIQEYDNTIGVLKTQYKKFSLGHLQKAHIFIQPFHNENNYLKNNNYEAKFPIIYVLQNNQIKTYFIPVEYVPNLVKVENLFANIRLNNVNEFVYQFQNKKYYPFIKTDEENNILDNLLFKDVTFKNFNHSKGNLIRMKPQQLERCNWVLDDDIYNKYYNVFNGEINLKLKNEDVSQFFEKYFKQNVNYNKSEVAVEMEFLHVYVEDADDVNLEVEVSKNISTLDDESSIYNAQELSESKWFKIVNNIIEIGNLLPTYELKQLIVVLQNPNIIQNLDMDKNEKEKLKILSRSQDRLKLLKVMVQVLGLDNQIQESKIN
jgi:hypothetical protein